MGTFTKKHLLLSGCILLSSSIAFSWSNHGLSTYIALKDDGLISKKQDVVSENLVTFLNKEKKDLNVLLNNINTKLKQMGYTLPKSLNNTSPELSPLQFNPNLDNEELKLSFLRSLRLSTKAKYVNFLQDIPHAENRNKTKLNIKDVSTISTIELARRHFLKLQEGDLVSPVLALATYVDEPDFGLDINLFTDSQELDETGKKVASADGKLYEFGKQPFGNPILEYGTQAPFHIAFGFESTLVYAASSVAGTKLKDSYALMRITQYTELSKFAFAKGHDYWGYRFAAWALHYVGDLTQPYHSTVAPGHTTAGILKSGLLGAIGLTSHSCNLLNEVTALHTAIEEYQFKVLAKTLEDNDSNERLSTLLQDKSKDFSKALTIDEITTVVAKRSNQIAHEIAAGLKPLIGEQIYLRNDTTGVNFHKIIADQKGEKTAAFDRGLDKLMLQLGSSTRGFLMGIVPQ